MILWLDDVREPWKHGYINATWVKTAQEAIELLSTGKVQLASLDHDLEDGHYPWQYTDISKLERTGYDVVLWLESHPEFLPQTVLVHSANPEGRARMLEVLGRLGRVGAR
jgi:hypothetical protein